MIFCLSNYVEILRSVQYNDISYFILINYLLNISNSSQFGPSPYFIVTELPHISSILVSAKMGFGPQFEF